jgi:hypothetical protein
MPTMMQPTPGSEVSVYFDAPITHFHSSPPNNNTMDQQSPRTTHNDAANMNLDAVNGRPAGDSYVAQGLSDQNQNQNQQHDGMPLQHRESLGWLPATDLPPNHVDGDEPHEANRRQNWGPTSSATSLRSAGSMRRSGSLNRRAASVRSTGRQSLFTNKEDGTPMDGSTFINGAGTTGPSTQPGIHDSVLERSNSVKAQLTPKQSRKVSKFDAKESKALSKIIKQESKVEKQALSVAIKELAELQTVQKVAVKREAKAHTAHHHSLTEFQKAEQAFIAARRKYEVLQAQLNADNEALEISRQNAREATIAMQDKSREIEGLRVMVTIDEGERQLRLDELKGKKPKGGLGRQMNGSESMRGQVNGAQNGVPNGVHQNGTRVPEKQAKRNNGFLRKMTPK